MKKVLISALAFSALMMACSTPSFVVKKVGPSDNVVSEGHVFYQLPVTSLQIIVEQTHTVFIPGPYAAYATRYLGIENASTQGSDSYDVAVVKVNALSQPDPQSIFMVEPTGNVPYAAALGKLVQKGLVTDPLDAGKVVALDAEAKKAESVVPDFLDLSISDFEGEKVDTLYKTVFRDSGYVRVPVTKKVVAAKDADDKAREAAQLITKLRKRRSKLITWQYENVNPSGEALRSGLEEMKRIEAEYLSLFIGKTYIEKSRRVFYVTPSATDKTSQTEIFRYDSATGIAENGRTGNKVVYLKLSTQADKQKNLTQGHLQVEPLRSVINSFYVRIPENADISVVNGSKEIYKASVPVFQLGTIVPVLSPADK
jgi:hypothetical protein